MFDINELTNWPEYTKLFVGLFAMVPPPIIMPLFMSVLSQHSNAEKKRAAAVSSIAFLVLSLIVTYFGLEVLRAFGITLSAFRVAGGLLLLLMALDMLRSDASSGGMELGDLSASALSLGIVPLGIPILAGPGGISTVLIFAGQHDHPSHRTLVALVVVAITIYIFFAFRLAIYAGNLFTPVTILIFSRIMGLIIAAVAVEFILIGIHEHFPGLGPLPHH